MAELEGAASWVMQPSTWYWMFEMVEFASEVIWVPPVDLRYMRSPRELSGSPRKVKGDPWQLSSLYAGMGTQAVFKSAKSRRPEGGINRGARQEEIYSLMLCILVPYCLLPLAF